MAEEGVEAEMQRIYASEYEHAKAARWQQINHRPLFGKSLIDKHNLNYQETNLIVDGKLTLQHILVLRAAREVEHFCPTPEESAMLLHFAKINSPEMGYASLTSPQTRGVFAPLDPALQSIADAEADEQHADEEGPEARELRSFPRTDAVVAFRPPSSSPITTEELQRTMAAVRRRSGSTSNPQTPSLLHSSPLRSPRNLTSAAAQDSDQEDLDSQSLVTGETESPERFRPRSAQIDGADYQARSDARLATSRPASRGSQVSPARSTFVGDPLGAMSGAHFAASAAVTPLPAPASRPASRNSLHRRPLTPRDVTSLAQQGEGEVTEL